MKKEKDDEEYIDVSVEINKIAMTMGIVLAIWCLIVAFLLGGSVNE